MPNSATYVPVSQIIGDAARELGDLGFMKFGRPAYISATQRALSRLFHDVPADTRHFEAEVPQDLILKLPWGITEKSLVVLFNGPTCNYQNVQTLFIKPNMYHHGYDPSQGFQGYVANNTGLGGDIVPGYVTWSANWPQNWLYFAGEANGNLYMSYSCLQFQKIHITYTGLGMDCWGDDFCVPEWAREAITDMVILRAARTLRSLNNGNSAGNLFREIIKEKEMATAISNPNGTWLQALGYWGRMDEKTRNDVWTATTWYGVPPY